MTKSREELSMSADRPLIVKCAGGAAAQTLGLMDAIFVTQQSERKFTFEYYPYGTGTYWPFEIEGALLPEEIGSKSKLTRGHDKQGEIAQVGKIVENHPINKRFLNREKVYALIRNLKLDRFLLALRGELAIGSTQARLKKVKKSTRIISGGYLPVLDHSVFESLHQRFIGAGYPSPFDLKENIQSNYDVVIHYRIGDKRAKFTNPGVVGSDGIMDPGTISRLLSELGLASASILVLSDEPEVAQRLLSEAGLSAYIQMVKQSIWEDLRTMAVAGVFVGSWSQVSQLASVCVVGHGGIAYLPCADRDSVTWSNLGVKTYLPEFLDSSHPVYYKK